VNEIIRPIQTKYYIYKVECKELNKFYIGSHFCTGKSSTCKKGICNYQGSGKELFKLKNKNPYLKWNKVILQYAENRKQLAKLEVEYIRANISDTRCINKIIASPTRLPMYSKQGKQKLKASRRRKTARLYNEYNGEILEIPLSEISIFIKQGWHFDHGIHLKNSDLKTMIQLGSETATKLFCYALKRGWQYGFDSDYKTIKLSKFLKACNLIRKQKTTTVIHVSYETLDGSDLLDDDKEILTLQAY